MNDARWIGVGVVAAAVITWAAVLLAMVSMPDQQQAAAPMMVGDDVEWIGTVSALEVRVATLEQCVYSDDWILGACSTPQFPITNTPRPSPRATAAATTATATTVRLPSSTPPPTATAFFTPLPFPPPTQEILATQPPRNSYQVNPQLALTMRVRSAPNGAVIGGVVPSQIVQCEPFTTTEGGYRWRRCFFADYDGWIASERLSNGFAYLLPVTSSSAPVQLAFSDGTTGHAIPTPGIFYVPN